MKKLVLSLMTLVLVGCADSSVDNSDLQGTWLLSSMSCNDTALVLSGVVIKLVVGDSTASTVYEGSGCTISADYTYTVDGDVLISAPSGSSCAPTDCSQTWTVNGNSADLACEDLSPNTGGNTEEITISDNIAVATVTVGELDCSATYLKQ